MKYIIVWNTRFWYPLRSRNSRKRVIVAKYFHDCIIANNRVESFIKVRTFYTSFWILKYISVYLGYTLHIGMSPCHSIIYFSTYIIHDSNYQNRKDWVHDIIFAVRIDQSVKRFIRKAKYTRFRLNRRFLIRGRWLRARKWLGRFYQRAIWRYVLHMCSGLSTDASEISLQGARSTLLESESNEGFLLTCAVAINISRMRFTIDKYIYEQNLFIIFFR